MSDIKRLNGYYSILYLYGVNLVNTRHFFLFLKQMVGIRRVSGMKNPAEMTYYVQHNGIPLAGTSAAKVLNTVDSQIMALTLGYFVQLQAERKQIIRIFLLFLLFYISQRGK